MKISGIYKIQSIVKPEMIYIGSSVNVQKRWWSHLEQLRKNKHENKRLQNHFNKYGESDFIFIIVEPCLQEFLIIREQYYIDILNPLFNILKIAGIGSQLGNHWKMSESARLKIVERQKGNKNNLGKHRSEESKNKVRGNKYAVGSKGGGKVGQIPWNKGKKGVYSEEVLNNMRKSHLKLKIA